jgi:hypothetical protein
VVSPVQGKASTGFLVRAFRSESPGIGREVENTGEPLERFACKALINLGVQLGCVMGAQSEEGHMSMRMARITYDLTPAAMDGLEFPPAVSSGERNTWGCGSTTQEGAWSEKEAVESCRRRKRTRSFGALDGVKRTDRWPRVSGVQRSASSVNSVAEVAREAEGSGEVRGSSHSMSGRPSALVWRRGGRFGLLHGIWAGPPPRSHGKSFGTGLASRTAHGVQTPARPASPVDRSWRSFGGTPACAPRSRSG